MSTWLFDLGNSRLKFAPLDAAGGIGEGVAVNHDGAHIAPGWLDRLPARLDVACVATVASVAVTTQLLDALVGRCGRISLARTQPELAGVRIAYADAQRLGVDRFLALIAARARAERAALVVGVGTAMTIDLLDGDGLHRGGRIAPSPGLMRAALHARSAVLPLEGGRYAEFATDTTDALASGCDGAALALVAHSMDFASTLMGSAPALLVHGGGAPALLPRLPAAVHAPTLVLEGLARWARL
ncbi:MAG: type III pantothenate kinase [Luteimonas sp.]